MADSQKPETVPGSAPETPTIPPGMPEERDAARESAKELALAGRGEIQNAIAEKLRKLTTLVMELGSDFMGPNDDPATVEQNLAFREVITGLQKFLDKNTTETPEDIRDAWMEAAVNFLLTEIRSYHRAWGEMGITEVTQALAVLEDPAKTSEKTGQKGIGNFETWVAASPFKEAYDQWKNSSAEKAQTVQSRTALLGEVAQKLETPFATVKDFAPAAIGEKIASLKENIDKETGGMEKFTAEITFIEGQIEAAKTLQPLAENEEIPKEVKNPILEMVIKGTKTIDEAKKDLEKALEEARKSPPVVDEGEDTPTLDSWKRETEGTWYGAALAPFVAMIAKLFGSLCKGKRVREFMVSQNLISHTELVEQGIEEAKIGQKVEIEFRRFGLGTRLANMLGGKKTKDVVAAIRDPEKLSKLTEDETRQAQFKHLANQIEERGGAKTDATLWEFIGNNPKWTGVPAKPEKAPAAPTVAPAAVLTPAPKLVAASPAASPPPASPPAALSV